MRIRNTSLNIYCIHTKIMNKIVVTNIQTGVLNKLHKKTQKLALPSIQTITVYFYIELFSAFYFIIWHKCCYIETYRIPFLYEILI